MQQPVPTATRSFSSWRTPAVIVACGCLIAAISYGPRSSFGFFMAPMTLDNGWGRDVFALSVAMQTLIYGMAQPFSGALADKFGTVRVIIVGALLYASGVFMMSRATTPGELYLTSGVLIGLGLTGCSFSLIIPSFGKLLPESWRSISFGAGTAAGSFGQFLFSPLGVSLIDKVGWRDDARNLRLHHHAGDPAVVRDRDLAAGRGAVEAPARRPTTCPARPTSRRWRKRSRHRSFILLVLGYFTCGFQLQFVTLHLPSYLIDRGLSAEVGGWTLGIIGLFNIVGALLSGYLSSRMPKRYILAFIYSTRALAVIFLITMPASPAVALIYGAVTGLLWLSSIPPTTRPGRRDVRHPLAIDAGRDHVREPPDRRLAWRLSRRPAVRDHRLVQHHLVGRRPVRLPVGADQPADRREAGAAAGAGNGLTIVA